MSTVQLIADTNVVSYAFRGGPLGRAYLELMGDRRTGVTGMCLAELRAGSIIGRWGERKVDELVHFIRRFTHVREPEGMADLRVLTLHDDGASPCHTPAGGYTAVQTPFRYAENPRQTRRFPHASEMDLDIGSVALGRCQVKQ
jgi:hypothetical protein